MIESLAEKRPVPGWAKALLGFIAGVADTIITGILINWFSLGEADIVYVGSSTS
jgi:hypothetical protein